MRLRYRLKILRFRIAKFVVRMLFTRTFELKDLRNGVGEVSASVSLLLKGGEVKGPSPTFLSEDIGADFSDYDGRMVAPDVYIHEVCEAAVIGRTEFIQKNGVLYHPDIINPEQDVFMAELEGWARIQSGGERIRVTVRPRVKEVDTALSLLGQCNGNYLHFLTEAMTRLALAERHKDLENVPILIEEGLHPRLYEALDLLNRRGREVIFVREYARVQVRKLFYITPPCYTPPETRRWFEEGELASPRMEQFTFSCDALQALRLLTVQVAEHYVPRMSREEALGRGAGASAESDVVSPKSGEIGYVFSADGGLIHSGDGRRFYCNRRAVSVGNGRLVKNDPAVMAVLSRYNVLNVHLPDHSFPEQALILKDAEVVVSPVGASVGNLIFCEPGVEVVLLSPTYPGATYYYFANLLAALGHRLTYVLGRQVTSPIGNRYNRDFWMPVNLIADAMDDVVERI